jgi:hypothetical protein
MIARLMAMAGIIVCMTGAALAEPPDFSKLNKPVEPSRPQTTKKSMLPCPEFGAGFMRLPGSDSCVKIGGSVSVDAGMATVGR